MTEVVLEVVNYYRDTIPVNLILEVLNVPASSYYRWKGGSVPIKNRFKHETLVISTCNETKFLYGYRKITALLKETRDISHNTVQKIMQRNNLNCRVKPKKHRKFGEKA